MAISLDARRRFRERIRQRRRTLRQRVRAAVSQVEKFYVLSGRIGDAVYLESFQNMASARDVMRRLNANPNAIWITLSENRNGRNSPLGGFDRRWGDPEKIDDPPDYNWKEEGF